jgi:hypothetical protein
MPPAYRGNLDDEKYANLVASSFPPRRGQLPGDDGRAVEFKEGVGRRGGAAAVLRDAGVDGKPAAYDVNPLQERWSIRAARALFLTAVLSTREASVRCFAVPGFPVSFATGGKQ